ncbi:hypothetical protein P389DRAFT_10668 [Cystobasidium minutum MCA 4210]|uniref:uncharacterized protein n=1 Tax=Cystobasidium minutum MCA 4210 TaxID=1397322 RepID=UPI0034CD0791|eukprot:jgi/Rhomi1/10668/CE10667_119
MSVYACYVLLFSATAVLASLLFDAWRRLDRERREQRYVYTDMVAFTHANMRRWYILASFKLLEDTDLDSMRGTHSTPDAVHFGYSQSLSQSNNQPTTCRVSRPNHAIPLLCLTSYIRVSHFCDSCSHSASRATRTYIYSNSLLPKLPVPLATL